MPDEIFEDELDDYLESIADDYYDAVTHLREPFAQAEAHAGGEMASCILTGRTPGGEPYPPLAERTIKKRVNKGKIRGNHGGLKAGNIRPLIETGALIRSLQDGPGHVQDIEDTYFTTGTDLTTEAGRPYAAFQNFGAGNIPAREFGGFTPDAEQRVADLVADHIVAKMTR